MPILTPSDWLDILDDIRDQKAVLLIGPEVMQIVKHTLNRYLSNQSPYYMSKKYYYRYINA